MNNLELYGGPQDGTLMEMQVTQDAYGHTRRPAMVNVLGAEYSIIQAKDAPDKKPQDGVKYIGVFRGHSQ